MFYVKEFDAVNRCLFNKTKSVIFSNNFPWYYVATTAYTDYVEQHETLYNGSFYHLAMNNGVKNSEIAHTLEDCFLVAAEKACVPVNKLHRIRIGMIPICPIASINPPHVDMETPHKVGLLYLNNSDGHTYLYDQQYDPNYSKNNSSLYYTEVLNRSMTIKQNILPQENKMIFFDGLTYHSSSAPVNTKRRIAVNYVFD